MNVLSVNVGGWFEGGDWSFESRDGRGGSRGRRGRRWLLRLRSSRDEDEWRPGHWKRCVGI